MRILFDNVDFRSQNGPNSFAGKLMRALVANGHEASDIGSHDIVLNFIESYANHNSPMVQRLDGIYFNNKFDYNNQNKNILNTYKKADGVIFQTSFNEKLITKYFGEHENSVVIRNGADVQLYEDCPLVENFQNNRTGEMMSVSDYENVWCCASNWRPHKRLWDNISYYIKNRGDNDMLIVGGNSKQDQAWGEKSNFHDKVLKKNSIFFANDMPYGKLLQLYKTSKYFIHLAWLDHCPNVVVDARAMGCQIICSDSGGTKEIAGENAILIQEEKEWDYSPVELYKPPKLDYDKKIKNTHTEGSNDIKDVAEEYVKFFEKTLEKRK